MIRTVVVNSGAIGAHLASCHDFKGCFVMSVTSDVSAIRIGDMLLSISKQLYDDGGGEESISIDLSCLSLPEIQSQIQTMPRPFKLTLERGTGAELNYFDFLQCPVRGSQFLDSCDDSDSVDLYLTLCHLAAVDITLLQDTTVIASLAGDYPFVQNAVQKVLTCPPHIRLKGALIYLLPELRSIVEGMIIGYVKSDLGSARMAYWKNLTYPSFSLADILVDMSLTKALFFFAQHHGLHTVFFGLNLGTKDTPKICELSSRLLLQLAQIVPNASMLRSFSEVKTQMPSRMKISAHAKPFEKNISNSVPDTTCIVVFEDAVNIRNIFTKSDHGLAEGTEQDLPHKLLAYATDLIRLVRNEKNIEQSVMFRHGNYWGIIACSSSKKILIFTNYSISFAELKNNLVCENEHKIISDLAMTIKFTGAINLKINSVLFDRTAVIIIKELFDAKSLIILFIALLTESRIIFLSEKYYSANVFLANFLLELIAPFKWQHILESIIPDENFGEILSMPFPYLIGVPSNIVSDELFSDEIFIYDIGKCCVKIPSNSLDILRIGEKLSRDLDEFLKPVSSKIDELFDDGVHPPSDDFFYLSAIKNVCNSWVLNKIANVSECTTVIGDEVFFDEKQFAATPTDSTGTQNDYSEQEFLLSLSRTQHFSVFLCEKFLK
jgi:hypothetical protein